LTRAAAPVVTFQGVPGAFSHAACLDIHPDAEILPMHSFEETIEAVRGRRADLAVLPIENSTYGRVTDLHHLLPNSGLFIVAEHFMPVSLQLLALPGAHLEDVGVALSHAVALGQCRGFLRSHGIRPEAVADTAGAARAVAALGDRNRAAVASRLAGEIHGLKCLAPDIHDNAHNTTRFLVMARESVSPPGNARCITSFVFAVRNIPAALYKALGGFATNSVNMVKLESYMLGGSFTATQFYADIEGHPDDEAVQLSMDELRFFCSSVRLLGTYEAHAHRRRKPTDSF